MFCDIHSHILWATDDGAGTAEDSLAMMRKACSDGISHMIATPHFIPGKYEVFSEVINEKVNAINALAENNNLNIKIYPGCEISADKTSLELLSQKKLPSLCNSSYVLIELDEDFTKECITNMIDVVLGIGYTPVIAHAERSIPRRLGVNFIKALTARGALIQINASSITGHHTPLVQRHYVKKLLKSGLVFAVASDCHSTDVRPPVLSEAAQITEKYIGSSETRKLFLTNPIKIIENMP